MHFSLKQLAQVALSLLLYSSVDQTAARTMKRQVGTTCNGHSEVFRPSFIISIIQTGGFDYSSAIGRMAISPLLGPMILMQWEQTILP